jgi:hypothetical protein
MSAQQGSNEATSINPVSGQGFENPDSLIRRERSCIPHTMKNACAASIRISVIPKQGDMTNQGNQTVKSHHIGRTFSITPRIEGFIDCSV